MTNSPMIQWILDYRKANPAKTLSECIDAWHSLSIETRKNITLNHERERLIRMRTFIMDATDMTEREAQILASLILASNI